MRLDVQRPQWKYILALIRTRSGVFSSPSSHVVSVLTREKPSIRWIPFSSSAHNPRFFRRFQSVPHTAHRSSAQPEETASHEPSQQPDQRVPFSSTRNNASHGMVEAYNRLMNDKGLPYVPAQLQLAQKLDLLRSDILDYEAKGHFDTLLHQNHSRGSALQFRDLLSEWGLKRDQASPLPATIRPLRSKYIWGDVGIGKTMLLDLFFNSLPTDRKLRLHYHEFILDVGKKLHAFQSTSKTKSQVPIVEISREIASKYKVICLDEFQVTHISDAMILKGLCQNLNRLGCLMVVTTNRPPEDLYKGGLNHTRFLPFIHYVQSEWDVHHMDIRQDFRKTQMNVPTQRLLKSYFVPSRPLDDILHHAEALHQFYTGEVPCLRQNVSVPISDYRDIIVPYEMGSCGIVPFSMLCDTAVGSADYYALTQNYRALFVHSVPAMQQMDIQLNEIRRFIQLLDIAYDRKNLVILDAEVPLFELFGNFALSEALNLVASKLLSNPRAVSLLRTAVIKAEPLTVEAAINAIEVHLQLPSQSAYEVVLALSQVYAPPNLKGGFAVSHLKPASPLTLVDDIDFVDALLQMATYYASYSCISPDEELTLLASASKCPSPDFSCLLHHPSETHKYSFDREQFRRVLGASRPPEWPKTSLLCNALCPGEASFLKPQALSFWSESLRCAQPSIIKTMKKHGGLNRPATQLWSPEIAPS